MLPVFFRELAGKHQFSREPEPDLVMTDGSQVLAYEKAGRTDGVMRAAYLFHAARISMVIQGAKEITDLACGPATQLCMVAELNPEIFFTGIDYSENMLASARAYADEKRLKNVVFQQADISNLEHLRKNTCGGVISTMALHHLPTMEHLTKCFKEIQRIIQPRAPLYLADFGRLKHQQSVRYFAYMNQKHQPELFTRDYERSLRAAFLKDEFLELKTRFLPDYDMYSTFVIPLIVLLKSSDKKLDEQKVTRLKTERQNLQPPFRRILDDMRLFLKLGGLKNDPFTSS